MDFWVWWVEEAKTNTRRHPNISDFQRTIKKDWGKALVASKIREVCTTVVGCLEKCLAPGGGQLAISDAQFRALDGKILTNYKNKNYVSIFPVSKIDYFFMWVL